MASFNLLLCIKYQLMWQRMDGHRWTGIPHHCWYVGSDLLGLSLVWSPLVVYGSVELYSLVWFGM